MLFLVTALISAPAPLTDPSSLYVKSEVAVARVKACGFSNVAVRADKDLEEDVIEVSGVATASEQQMRCVAEASLATIYYVQFPEPLDRSYQQIYWSLSRERSRMEARAWLDQRGLLAKLPMYDAGKTDDLQFARKLETLCGLKAGGAFVLDRGHVTMKMGPAEHPAIGEAAFTCLMYAGTASGYPLGFGGNEQLESK